MTLPCGRVVPFDDVVWVPIWRELEGRQFATALDLARWIGRFYGFRSTTPTHAGMDADGIGWWVTNALHRIETATRRVGRGPWGQDDPNLADLVRSKRGAPVSFGTLIAAALHAAGVMTLSVEEVDP